VLFRIFSAGVAAALLILFLSPPLIKLREAALSVVIAIGSTSSGTGLAAPASS
jgi:hypothetical protein